MQSLIIKKIRYFIFRSSRFLLNLVSPENKVLSLGWLWDIVIPDGTSHHIQLDIFNQDSSSKIGWFQGESKGESSRSLIGSPLPLHNRGENCPNCDGPFSPGHQCRDEEKAGEDDGSDSEEEESDEDSEPPGDFDPPPVLTLLQTLSSLTDDDKKRAVLALQLQLNSIIDNKWYLHGDLYASLAGGIYR